MSHIRTVLLFCRLVESQWLVRHRWLWRTWASGGGRSAWQQPAAAAAGGAGAAEAAVCRGRQLQPHHPCLPAPLSNPPPPPAAAPPPPPPPLPSHHQPHPPSPTTLPPPATPISTHTIHIPHVNHPILLTALWKCIFAFQHSLLLCLKTKQVIPY